MGPWRRPIISERYQPKWPWPEWFGSEALAAAVENNDFVASIVRENGGRFTGIGVITRI
jgi:hypothetical protein